MQTESWTIVEFEDISTIFDMRHIYVLSKLWLIMKGDAEFNLNELKSLILSEKAVLTPTHAHTTHHQHTAKLSSNPLAQWLNVTLIHHYPLFKKKKLPGSGADACYSENRPCPQHQPSTSGNAHPVPHFTEYQRLHLIHQFIKDCL